MRNKLTDWKKKTGLFDTRMPNWNLIAGLYQYLPAHSDQNRADIDAVREERLLFNEPDLILPLLDRLISELNNALKEYKSAYNNRYDAQMKPLQENEYFSKLTPDDKHRILAKNQLLAKPEIKNVDAQALLNHLQKVSLDTWQTRIAALSGQFQAALEEAITLSAPKAEIYSLPRRTLNSEAEVIAYVEEVKSELNEIIKKAGSVILK